MTSRAPVQHISRFTEASMTYYVFYGKTVGFMESTSFCLFLDDFRHPQSKDILVFCFGFSSDL